jgi:hypothetical protein
MDNKPLEMEAETHIRSELIKYGFCVTKPDFDTMGVDLLIIDTVKAKFSHILKIQCKGRNIAGAGSNISIPCDYVDGNFVVFLYLKLENYDSKLFIFFAEDISKWNLNNHKYILTFTKNSLIEIYFKEREFNLSNAGKLTKVMRQSKIQKYTSIFIDSIFLNNAIGKTIEIYKEVHPDKMYKKPSLKDVIENIIICYDNFRTADKLINIVYLYNPDALQATETIDNISLRFTTNQGVECKLRVEETDEFVNFEILEYLERTINNENIILVADDQLYESCLNDYKELGVEVTLVQFSSSEGRQMYTKHYWGDITYPIGRAVGLEALEL